MDFKVCDKCNKTYWNTSSRCIWCELADSIEKMSKEMSDCLSIISKEKSVTDLLSDDLFDFEMDDLQSEIDDLKSEVEDLRSEIFDLKEEIESYIDEDNDITNILYDSFLEDVDLDDDEDTILSTRFVYRIVGNKAEKKDALVLTNKNIVICYYEGKSADASGYDSEYKFLKIPLDKDLFDNYVVSVINVKKYGHCLRLAFANREYVFYFMNSRNKPEKWKVEIDKVLLNSVDTDSSSTNLFVQDAVICKACGQKNIVGFRFCEYCGTPVKDTVAPSVVADIINNRICSVCGFENDIGFKFCESCGTPVKTKQDDDIKICSCCGKQNKSKNKFCGYCGTTI